MEELLTVEEAAAKLKLATATVYRMVRRGDIPAIKIGKVWRISSKRLAALFEEEEDK